MYYNARYFDPDLGQFISPDTLVPDPTNLFDYNRYMYVRGNPMRYSDPTGHYSNDEIMKHFGCSDWACVESHFGEGGSHAGMWGWLYTLQQAVDGDSVTATMMFAQGNGSGASTSLTGQFQKASNGKININITDFANLSGRSTLSGVLPEAGMAQFAANGTVGMYELQGQNASFGVMRDAKYGYLKFEPSNINASDLGIALVKSGETVGPYLSKVPHPATRTAGMVWANAGRAMTLSVDVVGGLHKLFSEGDPTTLMEYGAGEYATAKTGTNAYGNSYDLLKVLSQGICYGTGCR